MKSVKTMKTVIFLGILLLCQYSYSQNNMANKSFKIPLKVGRENPSVQFETLHIEPIYLIVQKESDRSPNIELGLNVAVNDREYRTLLTYSYDNPEIYHPKAFEEYVFGLDVNNDSVNLVVEKMDFGKVFFLELDQKSVIGNFSILFESIMSDWSVDPDGNYLESREHFNILVSDNNEQKELHFGALYAKGSEKKLLLDSWLGDIKDNENELLFEWKDYQIFVLDASERILTLKICKK
jgi:hypothetical protein